MSVEIACFDTAAPDDVAGLAAAIDRVGVAAIRKLAVFVKVAGAYDDGSRERARRALETLIARSGLADRTQLLLAVGCEGVATPFGYALIECRSDDPPPASRLSIGFARSAPLAADALGHATLADTVATTVRAAMGDARLAADQVVMAFVKVPQPAAVSNAERVRGRRTRGIAALGAGIALGEIDPARVTDATLGFDLDLYARRAQTFAGVELDRAEAIVIGNRPGAGGALIACAGQMADLIDGRALKRMLIEAGLALDACGELAEPRRVAGLFVKAGPNADGTIRGARTTIYRSPIAPEQHMRAALSGLLAGVIGTTRFFHTGDPFHAAPEGGGVACAIVHV
ncbi:MAG: ring-opening amidohydrolase [Burkholderiales bacterium]